MNNTNSERDELRHQITVKYFNALTKGISLEQVSKIPATTLANGENFIDEMMELIERHTEDVIFSRLCTAYTEVVGHTLNENPKMSKSRFVSRFSKYLNTIAEERRFTRNTKEK